MISVPSGNFGDLTAGLLAKSLGLPVKRFIAATNVNDTVPRFLHDGKWAPKATQATLSNAMDVSQPNNWPRVEELFRRKIWRLTELGYAAVDDTTTQQTMRELKAKGYISEPHAAVAYRALRDQLNHGESMACFSERRIRRSLKKAWSPFWEKRWLCLKRSPNAPICRCFHIICLRILPPCVS